MDVAFFSVFQNSYNKVLLVTGPLREWGRAGWGGVGVRRDQLQGFQEAKNCSILISHFAMATSEPTSLSWA